MMNGNPYEPPKAPAPGYRRKIRYSWRLHPWDGPGIWVLAVLFAIGMAAYLASQWEVWLATRNARSGESDHLMERVTGDERSEPNSGDMR